MISTVKKDYQRMPDQAKVKLLTNNIYFSFTYVFHGSNITSPSEKGAFMPLYFTIYHTGIQHSY